MNSLNEQITEYLTYCECRKHLNPKTLKAYRIDLKQYELFCSGLADPTSRITVDSFITQLHRQYKTKTIKRKIASLKAFFHHMEYREQLAENPFARLDIRFREDDSFPLHPGLPFCHVCLQGTGRLRIPAPLLHPGYRRHRIAVCHGDAHI